MMNLMRNQRGMTGMGWMVVIVLVVGGALLSLKIAPMYIRHASIAQALHNVTKQPEFTKRATPSSIRGLFAKQLDISSIYEFDMDTLSVERDREGMRVVLDYEVREPIVGNLDVVARFYAEVEVPDQ